MLLRNGLVVAGRYAALRKQFGRDENEEVAILNYQTTQIKIIPALAEHFAYRFAGMDLVNRWEKAIVKYKYIIYNNI
jgi:acyl-CoA oxidase